MSEFGCTLPNCQVQRWTEITNDEVDFKAIPFFQANTTYFQYQIQRTDDSTVVTKHMLAYTFTNFVADFGGYLGLLLGASLLSIYDYITDILPPVLKQKK